MPTKLEIANNALAALGQEPLETIEDVSREARFVRAFWGPLRDEILRRHPWNFAIRRIILAENLLQYSEDWNQAAIWVPQDMTLVENDAVAPDGRVTADRLVDGSASTAYTEQAVTIRSSDEQSRTFSVYLKQRDAGLSTLFLQYTGGGVASEGTLDIEWADTPIVTASGDATGDLEEIGNGWYRFWITVPNNAQGHTGITCRIYPAGTINTDQGSLYAWGAQLNMGDEPEDYSPTDIYAREVFTPIHTWGFGYPLPCDFLRMVRLNDLAIPYRIESARSFLCNENPVYLEYVCRVPDTCEWDSMFARVMCSRLAAELAMALKSDMSQRAALLQEYEHFMNEGQWADSKEQQQPSEDFNGYTWLTARLNGSSVL